VRRLLALFVAGATAAALACGPSFHAIHEGNAHFEHCYAMEENPQSAMREKADCWRDWSENYTYGQTRDRIQYATARYVALTQAPNIPTDEAMMMAAPHETGRVSTINAPAPTNAFAPPPKVLDPVDAQAPVPRPSDTNPILGHGDASTGTGTGLPVPIVPLPAATCSDGCASTFRDCGGGQCTGFKADAGAQGAQDKEKVKTCGACERTYKTCMRGCFK
jgi:hypothetical protein